MGTVISLSSLGLSDGAPVDTALPSDPFNVAPLSLISNPSENVSDNAVGAVLTVPLAAGSSARRWACAQALLSNSRQEKSASVQVVVFNGGILRQASQMATLCVISQSNASEVEYVDDVAKSKVSPSMRTQTRANAAQCAEPSLSTRSAFTTKLNFRKGPSSY